MYDQSLFFFRSVLFCLCALLFVPKPATGVTARALTDQLIASTTARGCALPVDALSKIICDGFIQIGVRTNYKSFGELVGGLNSGFEIDLARLIASRLGVKAILVPVSVTNRIEKLLDGNVDMVLATMAHTVEREQVIHFIRPHYFSSPTAIVGLKQDRIKDWQDLSGKTICVPLGNYSNINFLQHQVRLMIFDDANRMIDAIKFGACSLIAHDRSFLIANVTGPDAPAELSKRFEQKFSFNDVGWGIGIRQDERDSLGKALSLILVDLHQSGLLLKLASDHRLNLEFLADQRLQWSGADCLGQEGELTRTCLLEPASLADTASLIARPVKQFEQWIHAVTGWSLRFPMLTGQTAYEMLRKGMLLSIVLVTSSIFSTLLLAFLFFRMLSARSFILRLSGRALTVFMINSPLILLLVLGYLVVTYALPYSATYALLTAVLVIGLSNGANGGLALYEASKQCSPSAALRQIVVLASIQLRACLINAAKASPVAAFVGVPELLAVLTDITSFTGERMTTYLMLSLFYLIVVQTVVVVSHQILKRLAI